MIWRRSIILPSNEMSGTISVVSWCSPGVTTFTPPFPQSTSLPFFLLGWKTDPSFDVFHEWVLLLIKRRTWLAVRNSTNVFWHCCSFKPIARAGHSLRKSAVVLNDRDSWVWQPRTAWQWCWMANLPTSFQPLFVTNCYPKTLVRSFTLNFLANGNFVSINHYRWSPITYLLKCSRKWYLYLFNFANDFFITS